VVVILESLRVLANAGFKPHNTLEWHFYGGEEIGLLGSQDIFADYRQKNKSVLAFVNEDMSGYSESGMFAVFEDYVDMSLTSYVRLVAEEYVGKTPLSGTCGYGCSDHASATAYDFRK
jgi:leucyl aminopeptidase